METNQLIHLNDFKEALQATANEIKAAFPDFILDYRGLEPIHEPFKKYDCTPVNTTVFATTGGDGVHYSILEISDLIQPVVMTVPMNAGAANQSSNQILGANLNEFLSLGYYNGWFPLEQLCYDPAWALDFYSKENLDADYQTGVGIQLVKKLRTKLGFEPIPLIMKRLKELEDLYFDSLLFGPETHRQ